MDANLTIHTLEPVYDSRSRILILGTMPSPKSKEAGFYYSHPQNRMWRVLSDILGQPLPCSNAEKKDFLLKNRIAMWDVLHSCVIRGADDQSITKPVVNDFSQIFSSAQICAVFTTGTKATALYRRHCPEATKTASIYLPSTSPANCRHYDYEALRRAYEVIKEYL